MRLKGMIKILMLMACLTGFGQSLPAQTDSVKRAEMREKIGLDLSVPDFETKRIDAKVMGERLAGILAYLMQNYHQTVYDRKLGLIASEQNEATENVYFQIKKLKFINAVKKGNDIIILLRADLHTNPANIKQTDITFHFTNGLSESEQVNELFAYICHYVKAREALL